MIFKKLTNFGLINSSKYAYRSCLQSKFLSNQSSNGNSNVETLSTTDTLNDSYDIVINGGGIVGFSLLTAIKTSPFFAKKRVLLIEQQSPPPVSATSSSIQSDEPRKFSNRVSAITLSSKEYFERLKIWNTLLPYAKPVQGMYVWSEHYQNGINFGYDSPYEDAMCYILENNRILNALHDRIQSIPNESHQISYKTSVIDITQDVNVQNSQTTTIKLNIIDLENKDQESKTIETKLLIGCDGYKSIVRSKSTLPYFEADLDQMGIVATLEVGTLNPENHIAFQRFISDESVIALLPLSESFSSLVLSVPKSSVQDWIKLSDQEFVQRLNNEIIREPDSRNILDKLASTFNIQQLIYGNAQIRSPPTVRSIVPKSRAAYPLGFGTTIPFMVGTIQPKVPLLQALVNKEKRVNTAIIGDAAHRIHPLAGQGLNLGLGDASTLFTSLDSKLSAGYELFSSQPESIEALSQALYDFERCRVIKLIPMMTAIHSMQTLFRFTPSIFLPIMNQMDLAKKLIVSFANSR